MNALIVILLSFGYSCFVAKSETITWTYSTGWDRGFVLSLDRESSSISLRDRKTDEEITKELHNSEDVLQYFAALIRRVRVDSIGSYADDGPENRIKVTDEKGTVKYTIYDVSPPDLFLHWKIQDPAFPADAALKEADGFLKQVDAFLLVNQLREIKNSYFEEINGEAKSDPFAKQDGADQPATAPGSKPDDREKPNSDSKVSPQ